LEHAEEAFSAVMKMEPKFEKANEIYFRLGIIYKQQQKYDLSLQVMYPIRQTTHPEKRSVNPLRTDFRHFPLLD
jgi:hypothetical protein